MTLVNRRRQGGWTRRIVTSVLVAAAWGGVAHAAETVDGRLGPGALYRLVRPDNWNGRLVLYAHGYVGAAEPVRLPPEGDLIIGLLAPQGVAVAFSSYSENGWSVAEGARQTRMLLDQFATRFGTPSRVYLVGASMGGLIAIKIAEEHPGAFDGVLPVCAAVGGTQRHFDYSSHTRALFDIFYPGALPGNAAQIPAGVNVGLEIVGPAIAAMTANPTGAFAMARIDQTPAPFATTAELFESIATAVGQHALTLPDILARTHGHPFFDNTATTYAGALSAPELIAINAAVRRYDASPAALAFMAHSYQPSGALSMPVLMLSTTRDPVLPGFHQDTYRAAVAAAGKSSLLAEQRIDRYGHCTFAPTELAAAFATLVGWVEFGIPPASPARRDDQ
jgi:pimeloyl-ACP methyl ester carboxylesterase